MIMEHMYMNAILRVSKQIKNMYILLTQMTAVLERILVIHNHSNFPVSLPLVFQLLRS